MRIKNLPSISSMNGSQDALVIEQTDGSEDKSRKVSPAQIKQYVLGNSIDDIYSVMGQMGAKNLIPYPYHDTTKTANGVTFTDNGDGTVTVSTESGGATADVTFDFRYTVEFTINNSPLKIGESYVLSCEDINSTASGYRLRMYIKDSNLTTLLSKAVYTSEGVEFVLPSNTFGMNIQIFIPSGTVFSTPFTFKPMLRLASDTDDTYQPYAKTNRQLTEAIGDLSQTGLTGDSVADQLADIAANLIIPSAGSSITVTMPVVWGYFYPDQYTAKVPIPTIAPNTNYTITLVWVKADNVPATVDMLTGAAVVSKNNTYFEMLTPRNLSSYALPNSTSCRIGMVRYTITFA